MDAVALASNGAGWWMEGVTAAAAAASAVAAVIALRIAGNANRVANAAAKRDEDRILREQLKAEKDERRAVAVAMLDALEALVVWAETAPGTGTLSEPVAKQEFRRLKIIAYREIALYTSEDMAPVRTQFNEVLGRISTLGQERGSRLVEIHQIARTLRAWIADWNTGQQASQEAGN